MNLSRGFDNGNREEDRSTHQPEPEEVPMFTKIECGECGGDYRPVRAFGLYGCTCGHEVHVTDITLDEGESLAESRGTLGYVLAGV